MTTPNSGITVFGPGPHSVTCGDNESLLQAWLRQGIAAKFSCRGGSCHTCMLRCVSGTLPPRAQHGIAPHLQEKGYFLPCLCQPTSPLSVAPVCVEDFITNGVIESLDATAEGWLLRLEPCTQYAAEPGQYTCVRGLAQSLSDSDWITPWKIVNRQEEDFYLHLLLSKDSPLAAGIAQLQVHSTVQLRPARTEAQCPPSGGAAPSNGADLWTSLDQGDKVRAVLEDFYARVYADPLLEPYFRGVTRERLIGKQYSFLCDELTGSHVYFGDNMRNTHHWMVIPNSVFAHRQQLLRAVLQAQQLQPWQIEQWLALEERHRADIVKDTPLARQFAGLSLPWDGYQEEVLSCGAVCDHCAQVVDSGETVLYHLRLGTISCARCRHSVSID